jgi:hypothetical protein
LGLWTRGPLVLLEASAPGLLAKFAEADPKGGWRYLLHVHLHHPHIGADWAAQAGCDPLAGWLIEHHQDRPPVAAAGQQAELLTALQWADGKN